MKEILVFGNTKFDKDNLVRPEMHDKLRDIILSYLIEITYIFEGISPDNIASCTYLDPTRACCVCDQFSVFRIEINKTSHEICLHCLVEMIFLLYPRINNKSLQTMLLYDQFRKFCKYYEQIVVHELNEGNSVEKQGFLCVSEIIVTDKDESSSVMQ